MFTLDIPGWDQLKIEHLVLDYNGTLAIDGKLHLGISDKLIELSRAFEIHVVTADTYGSAAAQLDRLPVKLTVMPNGSQAEAKLEYVVQLGPKSVVAVGNGRNDALMLEASALGIAVVHREGAAFQTLRAANIVVTNIFAALSLLSNPQRLIATLRA